ncbi:hypothetical protein HJFPF1_00109 [Paramyrothecium foliicola]|nr:hypothetical protein HJFPF1_00109 [Paramyrothecium foliicola]
MEFTLQHPPRARLAPDLEREMMRAVQMIAPYQYDDTRDELPPELRNVVPDDMKGNGFFPLSPGNRGFLVKVLPSRHTAWVLIAQENRHYLDATSPAWCCLAPLC